MLLTPLTLTSSFLNSATRRVVTGYRRYLCNKMAKPNVVFVLGAPGAGKGTQCQRIVDKFGFVHLSAGELDICEKVPHLYQKSFLSGDLLRAERKSPGSQYGELIEHHITNGTIVPVAITCSLLERAMKESDKNDFLIDGFPRNEDNLTGWNEAMGDKVCLKFVLNFDCGQEVCLERCLARGAAGSGRSDDNEESLKKRFVTFVNATTPIIKHFEGQDLVKTINAERSVEQVWADVEKLFE